MRHDVDGGVFPGNQFSVVPDVLGWLEGHANSFPELNSWANWQLYLTMWPGYRTDFRRAKLAMRIGLRYDFGCASRRPAASRCSCSPRGLQICFRIGHDHRHGNERFGVIVARIPKEETRASVDFRRAHLRQDVLR